MKIKEQVAKWSQTRGFMLVFGLVCLALAYLFGSLALNSGSLLDYVIALLFVVTGVRELLAGIIKRKKPVD